MKIFSGPLSMFGAKAQIALLEKGIDATLVMVPYSTEAGYQPKHPDVLRINPKGQVPVLIDGDVEIYDSTQIFEYLEDQYPLPALWPREPGMRAAARRLELASDEVFFANVIKLMRSANSTPELRKAARANIAAYYRLMDDRLTGEQFISGSEFGYADIAFYMAQLFAAFLGAPMADDTPRLVEWQSRVTDRASVAAVAGAMARFIALNGMVVPNFLHELSKSPRSKSAAIQPEQASNKLEN
ncbi:MAG: glutathione S-transferase family protein [Afipia sp.]|nr:glutathione S-transferase family protein [Afipia sp.]